MRQPFRPSPAALGALTLFAFSLWYLQPTVGVFSGLLDEGLVLAPADRILHGDVAYRDFYLYIGPLPPYLYAGVLGLLGPSVLSAHLLLALIRAACVTLLFLVSRRVVPPLPALVPALMLLFTFAAEPVHYVNHWVTNLFLLAGGWAIVEWARRPSTPGLLAAGAAAGCAVTALPQFGVALVAADLASLAWVRAAAGPRLLLRDSLVLMAGCAAAIAPWFLYLAAEGALLPMWGDLVTSNVDRVGFETVPWGRALGLLLAWLHPSSGRDRFVSGLVIAAGLLVGVVGALVILARDRTWRTPERVTVFALTVAMYAASSYKLLPSQFQLHQYFAFPLVAAVAWSLGRPGRAGLALLLALCLPLGVSYRQQAEAKQVPVRFPRGEVRVASLQEAEDLRLLVRFLEKRLVGRPAFLTPYEPNLYFLMDLRNPTRFPLMRPLQFGYASMEQALADLRTAPRARVFHFPAYTTDDFLLHSWPSVDLAAYRRQETWFLDRLLEEFDLSDHGAVQVFTRKGAAPPPRT